MSSGDINPQIVVGGLPVWYTRTQLAPEPAVNPDSDDHLLRSACAAGANMAAHSSDMSAPQRNLPLIGAAL